MDLIWLNPNDQESRDVLEEQNIMHDSQGYVNIGGMYLEQIEIIEPTDEQIEIIRSLCIQHNFN